MAGSRDAQPLRSDRQKDLSISDLHANRSENGLDIVAIKRWSVTSQWSIKRDIFGRRLEEREVAILKTIE